MPPSLTPGLPLGGRSCTGRLPSAAADLGAVEVDAHAPVAPSPETSSGLPSTSTRSARRPGRIVPRSLGHVEQLGRRPGGGVQRLERRTGRRRPSARPPRGWCRGRRRRRRCPSRSGRRPRGRGARRRRAPPSASVPSPRGSWGMGSPASAAAITARGACSVGTSQAPFWSISSMASSSRKMPCSMERTPLRSAALMPAAAWAWAITWMPAAVASSVIVGDLGVAQLAVVRVRRRTARHRWWPP